MQTNNKYSTEDIEFLKKHYANMTAKQISQQINKTPGSIAARALRLGLKKQIHKAWTKEENRFLEENYLSTTSEEFAKQLNRTVISINAQLDNLKLIKHPAWTESEIDYIKNNFINLTHKEMGEVLNRTEQAIRAKCFELDLYKKEIPWSKEEEQFLNENYMEMKTSDISKQLNRTLDGVQLHASRLGLKKSPYMCDYRYFDSIDTEEKAYWLGFLTADGWINKSKKTNAGVTGIELQYGDINHLKKFNKSVSGNYQITDRWRACGISTNQEKKHHSCIIRIFSLSMYNDLVQIGFTNNKSFDGSIPKLRPDLTRHFVRGYFDGNGSICLSRNCLTNSFATASQQLKNDLIGILKKENIDIKDYSSVTEFGTTVYRPTLTNKKDNINFLHYIYKDCTIYLDRKYKKYLKAMNY